MEYISDGLRRDVWDAVHMLFQNIAWVDAFGDRGFGPEEEYMVRCIIGRIQRQPKTEVKIDFHQVTYCLRSIFMEGDFNRVLDCLEIIFNELFDNLENNIDNMDHDEYKEIINKMKEFPGEIILLFDRHIAAYELDVSQRPFWFFPRVSKEQGEAVQKAIEILQDGKMDSAAKHLRQAAEHMKNRQYPDSVADSIHAVESVAGEVDPKSNKTLGKALDSLEKEGLLQNSCLKEALKKLHGYANQPGIRHGQQKGNTVNVGLDEAILMYGACASFAAYLSRKRQHSISECTPGDLNQQRRQDP